MTTRERYEAEARRIGCNDPEKLRRVVDLVMEFEAWKRGERPHAVTIETILIGEWKGEAE